VVGATVGAPAGGAAGAGAGTIVVAACSCAWTAYLTVWTGICGCSVLIVGAFTWHCSCLWYSSTDSLRGGLGFVVGP